MSKHTATPWVWVKDSWRGGFAGIDGPNGEEVLRANSANDGDSGAAWFEDFPSDDDRAFIVRAVNAHDQLVAALRFYAEEHQNPNEGPWGANSIDFGDIARAALASVEPSP